MIQIRKVLPTILFYILLAGLIYLTHIVAPSSVCGPNFDFFLFFGGVLASFFLFGLNLYQSIKKDASYIPSTVIHGLVIIVVFVFLALN